jgi:hypothetical protein
VIRDQVTLLPLNALELSARWSEGRTSRMVQGTRTDEDEGPAFLLCLPRGAAASLTARILDVQIVLGTLAPEESGTREFPVEAPRAVLRGMVVDRESGVPIPQAAVRIQGSRLETLTGLDGRFIFGAVPVADLTIEVGGMGYAATSVPVVLRRDDLEVTLGLSQSAVVLAPILVRAFSMRLDRAGFYERERRGTGIFLDRARIEAMRATNAPDLLRRIPSVRIETGGARGAVVTGRGQCTFTFIVDGSRTLQSFELEALSVHAIDGIEVYRSGADVPALFRPLVVRDPRSGNCGVVVIWTRDRFGGTRQG